MNQVDKFKTLPDNARIHALSSLFKYCDRKTWDIGFLQPNSTENKLGSGIGRGSTYLQLPTQLEIDENSDASQYNESALIFCDARQRIYNGVPRTRKVYAKSRKNPGGKEGEINLISYLLT